MKYSIYYFFKCDSRLGVKPAFTIKNFFPQEGTEAATNPASTLNSNVRVQ